MEGNMFICVLTKRILVPNTEENLKREVELLHLEKKHGGT